MRLLTFILSVSILFNLLPPAVEATAAKAGQSAPLRVVGDNNYPPFLFIDPTGQPAGYIADWWKLWEQKTGVKIELKAENWAEAQRKIGRGEADVIDNIFRTPPREPLYDFTPPYINVPVAVYSHVSIPGIQDVKSLRGFQIGVMSGDACIDILRQQNISDLREYPDYTALIKGALAEDVKLFCLDEYPANYYLYRQNAQKQFRKALQLYEGQFHRAVRKGNAVTLRLVEKGTSLISRAEDDALRKKWLPAPPMDYSPYIRTGTIIFAVLLGSIVLLSSWVYLTRAAVRRKTTELRESEEQFRRLFKDTHQAIAIIENGRFVDANPATLRLLAMNHLDQLSGRTPADISPEYQPDGRLSSEKAAEMVQTAYRNGSTEFEWQHCRADGELFFALVLLSPIRQNNREILHVTWSDITERKITEAENAKAQSQLQAMFQDAPIGISIVVDRRITWANTKHVEMFQYQHSDLIGHTTEFLYPHPEDFEQLGRDAYPVLSRGGEYDTIRQMVRKDGSTLWVHFFGKSVDTADATHGSIWILEDITERKTLEGVQNFLVERGWQSSDEEFFPALARFLSESLDLEFIRIDRLNNDGRSARNLAVYHNGRFEENAVCTLQETPFGDVVEKNSCCFSQDVTQLYPNDPFLKKIGAVSYGGATLWGRNEKPIGQIILIGTKPFANKSLVELVLNTVAPRASGELERLIDAEEIKADEKRMASLLAISQHKFSVTSDLLDYALEEILALSGSRIGYLYTYSEETELFTLYSWSRDVMDACTILEPQTIYQLEKTGIWGEAVRQRRPIILNDFSAPDPLKKGHPDGHPSLVRFMTVPVFDAGTIVAVVGVADKPTDYTDSDVNQLNMFMDAVWKILERMKVEDAVRASEEKFSKAFTNAPILMAISTLEDGVFIEVNNKYCETTGYSREELVGKKTADLGLINQEERELIMSMLKTWGHIAGMEVQLKAKDGKTLTTLFSGEVISYGKAKHLLSIVKDITEQRGLEEQLRQSQKMEAVGQLAGGVAHDFNNILQVISGYCGLLELDTDLNELQRNKLSEISTAADKAAQLTRGLLAFSRKQTLLMKNEDLNDIIQHIYKFMARIIGEDITITTSCCGGELPIVADRMQVDQVLINLATNARDAMQGGGVFSVRSERVTLDETFRDFHTFIAPPGPYALLTVSDTGVGISPEDLSHIFEPFFTTKEVGKGTGLGMAIIYGIIRQHNGFINVCSEPGHGTTFSIYFPIQMADEKPSTGEISAVQPRRGSETILVAEDDPSVRELVSLILKRHGYETILAEDGEDAVEKFAAHQEKIALVIMDVIMPKMNGMEAFSRIKQIKPDVKSLFSSGYTADFIENRGVSEAGIELIMKPVQPIELLRKVREILDAV